MNIVEQNTTRLACAPVNLTVPSVEDGLGECGLFGAPSGDLQGDVAGVETWWYGVTWRRSGPLGIWAWGCLFWWPGWGFWRCKWAGFENYGKIIDSMFFSNDFGLWTLDFLAHDWNRCSKIGQAFAVISAMMLFCPKNQDYSELFSHWFWAKV